MTTAVDRTLAALGLLSHHPEGLSVLAFATRLDLPPSAAHRLLNDLVRSGYAVQNARDGTYGLTMRLAAMGLSWMGRAGITDVVQPVLDRLARHAGELVRLSVADGGTLIWVAVAQGATSGLRYDPASEQGAEASLAYSASGRAWAATLPDDQALMLISQQGLTPPAGAIQGTRLEMVQVVELLARTRTAGYAEAVDCFLNGMAAIAVPLPAEGASSGCLSIAGPTVRLTAARRAELLPALHGVAAEIMTLAPASGLLRGHR